MAARELLPLSENCARKSSIGFDSTIRFVPFANEGEDRGKIANGLQGNIQAEGAQKVFKEPATEIVSLHKDCDFLDLSMSVQKKHMSMNAKAAMRSIFDMFLSTSDDAQLKHGTLTFHLKQAYEIRKN